MPLPLPKSGESQDEFIGRCMSNENIKKDFGAGSKQAQAVCFSQWRRKNQMQDLKLTYNVPITEAETEIADNFLIQGIAISSTTTGNNHKFLPEELRESAQTLKGVPLLVDHKNEISAIKGRVTEALFDESNLNVPFAARVIDKEIQNMIKDGRINAVSVGAQVKELDEEEGVLVPKGIIFKELSLVAIPADPNATFSTALQEAFECKIKETEKPSNLKKSEQSHSTDMKGGKAFMEEETQETPEETKETGEPKKTEEPESEESKEEVETEVESLKSQLAEYKAKERKHLEEKYAEECKTKNIKPIDVKGLTESAVYALIEQVKSVEVKEAPKKEVKEVELDNSLEVKGRKIVQGQGSIRGGAFWIE